MKKEKNENLMKMDGKPMTTDVKPMKQGLLSQIFHLYYDGFRTMTLGKTLWTIIFLVLKLFFFPDFINTNSKNGDKAGFVSKEILNR